jgi:hypothetical protein
MIKSEAIEALAAALSAAQSELNNAVRNSTNPFYKSSYADLRAVRDAYQEAFGKFGLALVQVPETDEHGNLTLQTFLLHKSGQFIGGGVVLHPVKQDPQSIGSAITYQRRYSAAAIAGVAIEDDDAEAATGHGEAEKPAKPVSEPQTTGDYLKHGDAPAGQPEGKAGGLAGDAGTIQGKIAKLQTKTGAGKKGPWERTGIQLAGHEEWFGTFDKEIAATLKSANERSYALDIAWKRDAKGYSNIVDATVIDEIPMGEK